jgi:hypothetical protein
MSILKYRPSLTSSQIAHILRLCKADMSPESVLCISALALFEHKIQNARATPAYIGDSPKSLADKLGLSLGDSGDSSNLYTKDKQLPYELYNRWLANDSTLTISQLEIVKQYRWENGLMQPADAKAYEASILGISGA